MSRRRARIGVIQYIYAKEFNDESFDSFLEYTGDLKKEEDILFAEQLAEYTKTHIKDLDELISQYAQWGISGISLIDKCILRVGACELTNNVENTPYKIVINEYIEITKQFSSDSSKALVNAILDKIKDTV